MSSNPIIDPACNFGSGLSDAEIKVLILALPAIIRANGYVCTNGQINNLELANHFTGKWAYLFRVLSGLHENQDFLNCIYDDFICGKINDKFWFRAVSGNGGNGASITLPAGTWLPFGIGFGGSDGNPVINVGDFRGGEADDGDDNYFVVVAPNAPRAGGTTFNMASINPQVSDNLDSYTFAMFAINLDC